LFCFVAFLFFVFWVRYLVVPLPSYCHYPPPDKTKINII
jgi:hypothetical protein